MLGLSLGGYQTSLLACLDDELACAIPGIPLTDIARAVWRHGPSLHLTHAEHHGVVHDEFAEILRVVSPLVLEPKVPHEHRAIFGGIGESSAATTVPWQDHGSSPLSPWIAKKWCITRSQPPSKRPRYFSIHSRGT